MYLVVFFLLLWALLQSVTCTQRCMDPNPKKNILYILQTEDNAIRNAQFTNYLKTFLQHDQVKLYPKPKKLFNCSAKLWDTMKNTKNLRYVINLHVSDFYQNSYSEVESNGFLYAGDIKPYKTIEEIDVCNRNFKKPNDTCKYEKMALQKDVKLVSKEVMSLPFLYELVYNFENPHINPHDEITEVEHKILICPYTKIKNMSNYAMQRPFNDAVKTIKYFSDKCDNQFDVKRDDEIIAVLAPNPSSIEETNKPVIFYEESFSLPEETAYYRNSVTRVWSWKVLADALLKFINEMDWNRVAVLSDGSVDSDVFEELLRELFAKQGLAHQVITVLETNQQYDFSKALKTLSTDKVRIIIANIDEKNMGLLARQASQHGMFGRNVLWIARSLSNVRASTAAKYLNHGVLVYFYPERTPITTIMDGINRVIHQSYLNTNTSYNFLNQTQFADDIRKELKWPSETRIHIQMATQWSIKTIAKYNAGVLTFKTFPNLPRDTFNQCILRSSNYNKPCNFMELIYLMMVITVGAVTILGITVFFQTPESLYNRM